MSGSPQSQRTDDPVAPGQLLADRFRVVRRIAQGGMGVVYEAYDEKLGRRIALKCARGGHGRRLPSEVRLATEISHPNICKIYEIHTAQTPDGPLEFFTMEFLEGPTLARRLEQDPLPRKEAELIARHLCAGLAEAHRRGIIHGDLKSANLILTRGPDGALRAVITDFGLACAAAAPGARGGTPGYMAPELYAGEPVSIASDIYAVGVILHELASGFRPDQRAAMAATTVTQLAANPAVESNRQLSTTSLPPLHSRWDAVLKRCLNPDPKQRYATADLVLQALGPSTLRRRILIVACALMFATVVALATYRQSTAPGQTVRLDIGEVQATPALAAQGRQLRLDAFRQIGQLRNSGQIAFSVQPLGHASRATHQLSADLASKAGKLALRAQLRDLRSGAPIIEWAADYAPEQLRYAPVALAGVVSRALHLPPVTTYATVNAAAGESYRQGLALLKEDKPDLALSVLHSAAALDPDSALPLAAIAEAQRRKSTQTRLASWKVEAAASYEQAELRNPDCAAVHRIAGLVEYDRNHPEAAIVRMRRATEFRPAHPDAFRRLGQLYEQTGQVPEALQAYSEAQRLAPQDVRIYQDLAHLYSTQSNFAEASKALQRAVELAPDRALFRTQLAGSYQDQGRFAEAEAELRSVLTRESSPATLVQLGHVLLYQKRDSEAIVLLSQAAGLESGNQFAFLYLGLACQHIGRSAEARKAFQHGLSVSQSEVIKLPRSGYNHALLAYFCAQTGQAERAALEAAQALQLAPRHNDTLWWTALAYERTGNRAAALNALRDAPLPLLEDLRRWPEASALTGDERFSLTPSGRR